VIRTPDEDDSVFVLPIGVDVDTPTSSSATGATATCGDRDLTVKPRAGERMFATSDTAATAE
jgi:hypothetical protein